MRVWDAVAVVAERLSLYSKYNEFSLVKTTNSFPDREMERP